MNWRRTHWEVPPREEVDPLVPGNPRVPQRLESSQQHRDIFPQRDLSPDRRRPQVPLGFWCELVARGRSGFERLAASALDGRRVRQTRENRLAILRPSLCLIEESAAGQQDRRCGGGNLAGGQGGSVGGSCVSC